MTTTDTTTGISPKLTITSPTTGAEWELVVGLEVHCELATATKLFCSCPNQFGDEPNTNALAGMRCPNCKSTGPFEINATACFTVYDDGAPHSATSHGTAAPSAPAPDAITTAASATSRSRRERYEIPSLPALHAAGPPEMRSSCEACPHRLPDLGNTSASQNKQ